MVGIWICAEHRSAPFSIHSFYILILHTHSTYPLFSFSPILVHRHTHTHPTIMAISRLLNRSISGGGTLPFFFLRRCLYTAESVLARDLFLQNSNPKPSYYARSTTDFVPELDGYHYNQNIVDNLHEPEFQALMQSRTNHIQNFVGEKFPLLFEELVCTVCGLANMSVLLARSTTSQNLLESLYPLVADSAEPDSLGSELVNPKVLDPGSPFARVLTQQDTLREVGKRFFVMQAQASTTFADSGHLATHHRELELSLMVLNNSDSLVCDFMKLNSLYDVVVPYRGAHSAGGVSGEQAKEFRAIIRDQTCVGSFYTLLGLLLSKFGSVLVREDFWNNRVLDANTGIVKIATDHYSAPL